MLKEVRGGGSALEREKEEEKEEEENARAQSLPPGAVVSAVAFATSPGALGSTQLRKTYKDTSKTYFFSSSCLFCFSFFREGGGRRWGGAGE